jgi:hypothetical protein
MTKQRASIFDEPTELDVSAFMPKRDSDNRAGYSGPFSHLLEFEAPSRALVGDRDCCYGGVI